MKERAELSLVRGPRHPAPAAGKCKLVCAAALGPTLLAAALVLALLDPVRLFARYMSRVDVGTDVYRVMTEDLEGTLFSAYLFNVTNPREFLSGEDYKLKLNEVGPFTYKMVRRHERVELDKGAGVLRYSPRFSFTFYPELSVADPSQVNLTLPNISLLSAASMLSQYSYLLKMAFNVVTTNLKTEALMSIDAHSYLWGYDDPLIALSNSIAPGLVHFDNMGMMERLYDKSTDRRFEVSSDYDDKFMIKTFNGLTEPKTWAFDSDMDSCKKRNKFVNTYEGILYPNDVTPETPIRVFHTGLCRIMDVEFVKRVTTEYGAEGLLFQITNRTYALDDEDLCTCTGGTCAHGILDLSYCYFGLPLGVTNSHFLDADPKLYERLEGINVDPDKDRSTIIIEPVVGISLSTELSLQINVIVKNVNYNSAARPFSEMVVPIIRARFYQDGLPEEAMTRLHLMYNVAPYVLVVLQLGTALAGLVLTAYAVRILYWKWICSDAKRKLKLLHGGKVSNAETPLTQEAA